jgi:hypothetical protein
VARQLHCKVAREAIGAFHENAAHAIAGNPVQHCFEARPLSDGIDTSSKK